MRVSFTVTAVDKIPFAFQIFSAVAAVTDDVSFTAVPANTAKPSVPKPTACPNVGKMSAARILNRKITEIDCAISSSSASITGAVAAIAEPPQIDEPTPIRHAALGLIFAIFITANAVMRDVEIVLIITGRLLLPTLAIVPRLSEKPSMITAHCRIFFEVNFIPPEKLAEVWRRDYERMQEYFIYGDSLPYDRLIARMAELRDRFRKVVMEDDFFSESEL